MRHEGLGAHSPCETCGVDSASYRCLDCFTHGLSCEQCIVHQHAHHPLHEIQVSYRCRSVPAGLTLHFLSGGTANSSPVKLCLTWVYPTNSATTSVTHALSLPFQSTSCSSTSRVSIPSGLPTVFVTTTAYNLAIVASNFSVPGGFRPLGTALVPLSLFASSTLPTSFRQGARSTSMISTLHSCQ